jgi:hypothetical protein
MEDHEKRDHDKKPKAEQRALEPNAEGNVRVEAIMGPYRGQHLTMTAADGQAAIDAHWARNPADPHYEHDMLSDEERTAAWDGSHAWAKTQWDAAAGIEQPPPPEGGEGGITRRRSMAPDKSPGSGYQTRHVEPKP